MDSIDFLNKIGKPCNKASLIKPGDIVGRINISGNNPEDTVRLYCVKDVELKPTPPFITLPIPRVYFHPPHVGLVVHSGEVIRHYIHTPFGFDYQTCWADYSDLSEEEKKEWDMEQEWNYLKDEIFDLYLITDEKYIALGNLIPDVIAPSFSFLAQTTKGEQGIYDFVDSIKDNLKTATSLCNSIKEKAKSIS